MRPSSRDRRPEDRTRQLRDGEGQNGGWWRRVDCKEGGNARRRAWIKAACSLADSYSRSEAEELEVQAIRDFQEGRPPYSCLAGCVVAMPGTT
jgi:hypothetical protein